MELVNLVEERGLDFKHVLFATFIGSFADMGVLNQVTVNFAAANVGRKTGEYFDLMGELPKPDGGDPADDFASVVRFINDKMGISPTMNAAKTNGVVEVTVSAPTCRYCLKGVGGAELPGTACPFPKYIEEVGKTAMGNGAPRLRLIDGCTLKTIENIRTIHYSFS
ncbi:MAG: hypothetical protein JSW52_00425 [Candidatus Coatesbacteria bacterium]|nr:MAG: hypothetical protein JSW52_00425 [Candidatus Coatesbacteria bacterium]